MQDNIQVLISIDVEPDERLLSVTKPEPWRGQEYLFQRVDGIREALEKHTRRPANFGWNFRLDPQIEKSCGDAAWPLHAFENGIASLVRAGDEFGIHPHAYRWDARQRTWITDVGDQSWVEHCVRLSLDAYESYFGKPCKMFRFGDGWINDETLDLIDRLGLEFDLTVEPGHSADNRAPPWEMAYGEYPDTRGAPTMPYRRSGAGNGRVDGGANCGLWMVPVSTAILRFDRGGVSPAESENLETDRNTLIRKKLMGASQKTIQIARMRRPMARFRWSRIAYERFGQFCLDLLTRGPQTRTVVLNMIHDHAQYACVFDHALAESGYRFVHTVLRSGSLAFPYARANFTRNIEFLLNHRYADRFVVSTPDRLSRHWDG